MPDSQTVSCEPCKRRKCKCDRKMPCCSQCSTLPSFCKYYENNKRGIPTGYLNALEQRLNETEDALYNALADLRELRPQADYEEHSSDIFSISARPANETKASRVEEWKKFPLKGRSDLDAWWSGIVDGNDRIQIGNQGNQDNSSRHSGFRPGSLRRSSMAVDSSTRDREQTISNLEMANRQSELRNQDTQAWSATEDNIDVFTPISPLSSVERPSRTSGPRNGAVVQNPLIPPEGRLVKSAQLTREMNHVYY